MSKRRKYSPEFKRGVVDQDLQPEIGCAQLALVLDINANLLTRW